MRLIFIAAMLFLGFVFVSKYNKDANFHKKVNARIVSVGNAAWNFANKYLDKYLG